MIGLLEEERLCCITRVSRLTAIESDVAHAAGAEVEARNSPRHIARELDKPRGGLERVLRRRLERARHVEERPLLARDDELPVLQRNRPRYPELGAGVAAFVRPQLVRAQRNGLEAGRRLTLVARDAQTHRAR